MRQQLKFGNGGWVCWLSDEFVDSDGKPVPVYVRFADHDGELRIVELYLIDDSGITATAMKSLPLGAIQAWANGHAASAKQIRLHLAVAGLDFRRAAPYFQTGLGAKWERHWAHEMLRAQYDPDVRQAPKKPAPKLTGRHEVPVAPKLDPPGGRTFYGAAFYRQVAEAYGQALKDGLRPGPTIAEASGVPVTTVHRWVKEARRRGFLPPGRPGKAG